MKKSSKFYHLLASLLLVVPLLFQGVTGIQTVKADATDSTVNVTLHKRAFDNMPADKQNTGDVMSDFGGKGLNGVTFTAYDVTDHFLDLRSGGKSAEDAIQAIQADAADKAPTYANKVGEEKTATKNDEDGLATFANLPLKDEQGNYKTYLFVETDSPTNVTQKAAPIVLNMPIYKTDSTTDINTNVHVYPKNETVDKEEVIKKDLDEDAKDKLKVTDGKNTYYNAQYGDKFGYDITITVPWNIKDKETFNVVDTPTHGLKDDVETLKVADGLLKEGTDYTVTASGNGYTLSFKQTAAVQAFAGKEIKISYDAILTTDAVPDVAANNTAELKIGNGTDVTSTPTKHTPDIYTGGAKFIKEDQDKESEKLAGAEFNLVKLDKDGKTIAYAKMDANGKLLGWSKEDTGATTVKSDANGFFQVQGLEYSAKFKDGETYAMVETKAPEGYAKLTEPFKFSVSNGSYSDTNKLVVKNVHKGILPSTGGHGIYLYLIAGVLIVSVAAAGFYFSRRREEV